MWIGTCNGASCFQVDTGAVGTCHSVHVLARCPTDKRSSGSITGSFGDHKSQEVRPKWLALDLGSMMESTMPNSLSRLLLRNLRDVFGENDPVHRRTAIDEIYHEDAVFHDPKGGVYRGREEIDRIAGVIRSTHPDFEYQPLSPPEESGDAGRVRWVSGSPGGPPAYAGTDFIVARNGRIVSVYLFFDSLPIERAPRG
jgi:hypothetical protein